MPAVRLSNSAVRATARRAIQHQNKQTTISPAEVRRQFSATPRAPASHGPQYDPPTGWLFGVKPGEKYQKEGWENIFFYGFGGSLLVASVAYGFKPDTS